jgi:hypothetical protein
MVAQEPNYISDNKDKAYNVTMTTNTHEHLHASANACGISANTVYHWMDKHLETITTAFIPAYLKCNNQLFIQTFC